MAMTEDGPRARWGAMRIFVVVGSGCIVAGGLVSAVTGPFGFTDGSWTAAYLVLVAGVAQLGLGAGQALLAAELPTRATTGAQLAAWNVGNIGVLGGTLAGRPSAVIAGGLALVVALVLFLRGVATSRPGNRGWLVGYRVLVVLLAASIPVGLVLSVVRHG